MQAGRLFGLTVDEWTGLLPVLVPSLIAFVVAVIKAVKGHKAEKMAEVLADAIEEAHDDGQDVKHVKLLAEDKARKAGVEEGRWGLSVVKERATERLKKKKNGGAA